MNQNIYSFEQRSTITFDSPRKANRIIIANRREPGAYWSNLNYAPAPGDSSIGDQRRNWLLSCLYWLSCCCCDCLRCNKNEIDMGASFSGGETKLDRQKDRRPSDDQLESANFDSGPFVSNEIITSKYTIWNFLPKNLFEQFRRLANFYFLTTAITQVIIPYSPIGPATSLLPLLFVVSTTALKQAYEDYLRHKLDRDVNNRLCNVLRNKRVNKVRSKDIRVGDIVLVRNDEEIPCDMILLASSNISSSGGCVKNLGVYGSDGGDRCYITTANLDGETSPKSRTCFAIRQQIGSIKEIDNTLLVVECEKPNATLYEFNGFIRAPKDGEAYNKLVRELIAELNAATRSRSGSRKRVNHQQHSQQPVEIGQQQTSLSFDAQTKTAQHASNTLTTCSSNSDSRQSIIQALYRRIKQSRASINRTGLAQIAAEQLNNMAGADYHNPVVTPITQDNLQVEGMRYVEIPLDINNLLPRASRLRNTNYIYGLVVYTGRDTRLAQNSHVKPNKFSSLESRVNTYLLIAFMILSIFTLISALRFKRPLDAKAKSDNPDDAQHDYSFIELFMAHFVLYNYLVPISLYVTLEFVKFLGTISVLEDKNLQVPAENGLAIGANSKSRRQIQRRADARKERHGSELRKRKAHPKMIGAQCNSSDLNEDLGQVEVLFSDKTGTLTENKMRFMACSIGSNLYRVASNRLYEQPDGLCALPIAQVAKRLSKTTSNRYASLGMHMPTHASRARTKSSTSEVQRSATSMSSERLSLLPPEQRPFDHRILPPLERLKLVDNLEHNHRVVEFFICLCLCSTITLNEQVELSRCLPDQMNSYDLQSASPDEESLILAASEFGVVMCKSNDRECYIAIKRSRPKMRHSSAHSPIMKQQQTRVKSTSNDPKRRVSGFFESVVETENSTDNFIVRRFERILTFEFNSTRKRMSVLCRDCDNNCTLIITKGSENVLDCIKMTHMDAEIELKIDATLAHFEAFSKSGLRTMLVARRQIGERELNQIVEDQREARSMSTAADREHQLAIISKQVESGMQLMGATAVEDSLQDGVPETIADLKTAGIKVWLLTGDKVETAVSVAYLCKLLDRDMELLYLVRQEDSRACKDLLSNYQSQLISALGNGNTQLDNESRDIASASGPSRFFSSWRNQQDHDQSIDNVSKSKQSTVLEWLDEKPRFALIADGRSLHYAMKYSKKELGFVCERCVCVLGCRLSPLQKAEVVEMIKTSEDKPICAAIGDGANDVSMIQEANVGIGIRGKEGRQAVNSSDFAINRFHMLNRLFFVHGHLFYHRTANTIHYFFYKNMFFVLPQFLYSFYNSSTATSLYHPIMLISYNLIFTSAPIILYGIFEVHIAEHLLGDHPRLYTINKRNKQMRYFAFCQWMLLAAIQSSTAFFLVYFFYDGHSVFVDSDKMESKIGFATVLFCVIILAVTTKLCLLARDPGYLFYLSIILSCFVLPVSFYIISQFDLSKVFRDNSLYGEFGPLFSTNTFWLATSGTLLATVIPDVLFSLIGRFTQRKIINSIVG